MLEGCRKAIALLIAGLALAGCGASTADSSSSDAPTAGLPKPKPQVLEPSAGVQAQSFGTPATDPVGDVNAHAPPLSQIRKELRLEIVYAPVTDASYIDPLQFVTRWERTDQGVDASMPVGAPILAPGERRHFAAAMRGGQSGRQQLGRRSLRGGQRRSESPSDGR